MSHISCWGIFRKLTVSGFVRRVFASVAHEVLEGRRKTLIFINKK